MLLKRGGLLTACAALAVLTTGLAAQKSAPPELAPVLAAAGTYVDTYAAAFGAVAGEENAQEIAAIGEYGGRTVRSDVVFVGHQDAGWFAFRDVFESGGLKVRPRDSRLVDALSGPPASALETARRIHGEGVRHHAGAQSINRAINVPMLALLFLQRNLQARSDFRFDGLKTIDRVQAALITFKETGTPRVLQTADNAPAEGRFWIEPGSGRVVQTELRLRSRGREMVGDNAVTVQAKIVVRYTDQPALGLFLPTRLDEEYELMPSSGRMTSGRPTGSTQTITGRLDYRNFRRLAVDVKAIVTGRQ